MLSIEFIDLIAAVITDCLLAESQYKFVFFVCNRHNKGNLEAQKRQSGCPLECRGSESDILWVRK